MHSGHHEAGVMRVIGDGFDLNSPSGGVEWSHLLSWTLWLYGGIFGLGTMAGEIEKPGAHTRRAPPHPRAAWTLFTAYWAASWLAGWLAGWVVF
jgi:hypothetical protein|eukprot:SAG25_NODE_1302_length_3354_cov_27.875576_4_plen_94_part_00